MKKNICKILIIATAIAFGLAGCSAEAKVERQLELGASSMEAGDYDAAIEAYEEVISLDKYEIEGYKGLVIAMDADERDNEEIIQVVKDATAAISEIKESEEGLSEEDEAAAKDLYVVAVEAVDSNTDDQVTVLENAVEVIGEDGMLPDDFKGMLENALADNVLNGMDTTLAYVEMLEKLLLGDEMPQVEEESEEASTEEVSENEDGAIIITDFGSYVCLGPNADYPDTMSDYEFDMSGIFYRITLPNDMCVNFSGIPGTVLSVGNGNGKSIQIYMDRSTNDTFSNGYSLGQGQFYMEEIFEQQETDELWYVLGISVGSSANESMIYTEKAATYDNQTKAEVYVQYYIDYWDSSKSGSDEISEYIMKSFKPITAENSVILNNDNNDNNASEQQPTGMGVPIQLEVDPTQLIEPLTEPLPNL